MKRFTPAPVYWDLSFTSYECAVFYYRYEDDDAKHHETIPIEKLHSRLWDKYGKRFADRVQKYCDEQLHMEDVYRSALLK